MRSLTFALLSLALLAAAGICAAAFWSATAEERNAEQLFERLTATTWTHHVPPPESPPSYVHLPNPATTIEFHRNGQYRWFRASCGVEKNDRGPWYMIATGKDSGLLLLGKSPNIAHIPFRLEDGKLHCGLACEPEQTIHYDSKDESFSYASLKPNGTNPIADRLVATPWVKANDFDVYRIPERLVYRPDGRFTAEYRNKSCVHEGSWSLYFENGRQFLSHDPHENNCDLRGGTASLGTSEPQFFGDLLHAYDCYVPEAKASDRRTFIVDGYLDSVSTRGDFTGSLKQHVATRIDLVHINLDAYYTRELLSLEVKMHRGRIVPNGGESIGEPVVLVQKTFEKLSLEPNKSHSHSIAITPPFDGTVWLYFALTYRDSKQVYDRRGTSYVAEIAKSQK